MDHKVAICCLWSPQFIVAESHNILEVTERLVTVHCGQRLQQLRGHSGENCCQHYTPLNSNAAAAATTGQGFETEKQEHSNGIFQNTILNYKRNMDS